MYVSKFSCILVFPLCFPLQRLSLAFDFPGNRLLWGCLKSVVLNLASLCSSQPEGIERWGRVQRQVSQAAGSLQPLGLQHMLCPAEAPDYPEACWMFPPLLCGPEKMRFTERAESRHVSLAGRVDTFRGNSCTKAVTITVLGPDQ